MNILNVVIDGATDAIYLKDADGRYLMINVVGRGSLASTPEQVVGKARFGSRSRPRPPSVYAKKMHVCENNNVRNH